jgi:hypothetical protein
MSTSDAVFIAVFAVVLLPIILAGLAMIIKDQRRKRAGEPRPHEVAQAQRQERIEAERLLIEKHNPSPTPVTKRPTPPTRP